MESIDDLSKSFKAALYERGQSPFYLAFSFSWIAWNWRLLFFLFYSDPNSKWTTIEKFVEIQKHYLFIDDYLWNPLWTSIVVYIIGNILTLGFLAIKNYFKKIKRNKIDKIVPFDEKKEKSVREQLLKEESRINDMILNINKELDIYKKKNFDLETDAARFNEEKSELEKTILHNGKKLEKLESENEELKNEVTNLNKGIADYKTSHKMNKDAIVKLESQKENQSEEIVKLQKQLKEAKSNLITINSRLFIHSGWKHKDIKEHYVVSTNTIFNARIILNEIGQTCTIYIGLKVNNKRYWIGFTAGKDKSTSIKGIEYNSTKIYETKEIIIQEYIMSLFFEAYPDVDSKSSIVIDCIRLRADDKNLSDIIFNYSFN